MTLLRNMLVREDGRDLVAAVGGAPGAGCAVAEPLLVRGAPTLHGRVDLTLRPRRAGARLVWRVRDLKPGTRTALARPGLGVEGPAARR